MWKKVLGWILIFIGILGCLLVLFAYLSDGTLNFELFFSIVVLMAFIWGGGKLARRKGWNKVLGWILFISGTLVAVAILINHWLEVFRVLPWFIITVLPIWGGWKLAHSS